MKHVVFSSVFMQLHVSSRIVDFANPQRMWMRDIEKFLNVIVELLDLLNILSWSNAADTFVKWIPFILTRLQISKVSFCNIKIICYIYSWYLQIYWIILKLEIIENII